MPTILPGVGERFADDTVKDSAGVESKHQRVKISVGQEGEATDVSFVDPLPIRDVDLLLTMQALVDVFERVQQQLAIITGVDIGPGERRQ